MRLPVWAALAASAAGCSLIIPLDYTGGDGSAGGAGTGQGGTTGGSPQGGTSNGAEAGAGEGGNGEAGSDGGSGGSSGRGGSDTGGQGGSTSGQGGTAMGGSSMGGVGGSSVGGEDNGGVPPEGGAGSGTAGGGMGGTAGGGRGGTAGGGKGGTAGGGMGGTAGCSFDLTSNPLHCGSCTNACPVGNECIDSVCVSSPCDELGCGSIQTPTNNGDGPRKDSVGTTNDVCVEVLNYTPSAGFLPAINCWNASGRTVEVNDVAVSCGSDQLLAMPKRKGGYCFHALSGTPGDTGFVMPYAPSGSCCKAPTGGNGGIGGTSP